MGSKKRKSARIQKKSRRIQKRSRRKSKRSVKRGGSRCIRPSMNLLKSQPPRPYPKSTYSGIQRVAELEKVAEQLKKTESRKVQKLVDAKVLPNRCNKQRRFRTRDSKEYARQSKLLAKKQPGGPAGDSPGNKFGTVFKQSLDKAIKPNITVESYDRAIDETMLPFILESYGNPPYTVGESSSRRSRTADIDELPNDIKNLLLSLERKSK